MAYLTLDVLIPRHDPVGIRLADARQQALDLLIDDRCRSLGVLVEIRAPAAMWPAIRNELATTWFADEGFVAIMQRYRFEVRLNDADERRESVALPLPAEA